MENTGKQSLVMAQIARQNNALGELSDVVGKLEERLDIVLRPEIDTKSQRDEPEQDLVCLANLIRDVAHGIEARAERVNRIISRLEL